jgi:hypothetical protein
VLYVLFTSEKMNFVAAFDIKHTSIELNQQEHNPHLLPLAAALDP